MPLPFTLICVVSNYWRYLLDAIKQLLMANFVSHLGLVALLGMTLSLHTTGTRQSTEDCRGLPGRAGRRCKREQALSFLAGWANRC